MNLNKDLKTISKKDLTEAIVYIKGDIKGRIPQNRYEDVCASIWCNLSDIFTAEAYTPLERHNLTSISKVICATILYENTISTKRILQNLISNINDIKAKAALPF